MFLAFEEGAKVTRGGLEGKRREMPRRIHERERKESRDDPCLLSYRSVFYPA